VPAIFVSYSRSDRETVTSILSAVEEAALDYWLDESDILPSMEYNAKILDGLASCEWFLLVMTPRSAASEYVKDELHWALTNRNGRIVPVMREACNPAAFHLRLARIQYLDLTEGNHDGVEQLQKSLKLVQAAGSEESLSLGKRKLGSDLEMISLLLTFISRYHQKHIRNLLGDRSANRPVYIGGRSVRHELRDLCTWGLLNRCPGVEIGERAGDGRRFLLDDVVELTDLGKQLAPHVS
jgi:hypothetical protein